MLISNFVYYIDFVIGSASAFAATTCGTRYSYEDLQQRGRVSNLSECSYWCTVYYGGSNVLFAYTGSGSSCTCHVKFTMSTTATYKEEMINCGKRSVCSYQYKSGSYTGWLSKTEYMDVVCNSDNVPGQGGFRGGNTCYCCPCTGGTIHGESCMGSQNGALYSSGMLVMAQPGASSPQGCYMVGVGGMDPSGLYEYTDTNRCYYKN